jgi:lysophospholipase L1-like esterase
LLVRTRLKAAAAAAGLAVAASITVASALPASAGSAGSWCSSGRANLAFLGASSETGYGSTGYPAGVWTYYPTTYGWTRRLGDLLERSWGTTTENYSHNGAMVSDYLPGGRWSITTGAVADLAGAQPTLVIIDLGGNEYWAQIDPAVFENNLRTMIANVRTSRPGVDIMLYLHEEISWPAAGNAYWPQPTPKYPWSQYAGRISTVASTLSTGLFDMRRFVKPSKGNPDGLWNSDGIHLNDAGQSVVNAAWWGWFATSC